VLLTVPPMLWAANAVVGRLMVGQVPPLRLNALRWAIGLLIMLPLGRKAIATREARAAVAARWKLLTLLGLLGIGAYNALQYLGLTTSSPLNITLIAASLPLWMLLIGATVYRQRPAPRAIVGALLSLAGVLVVLTRGEPSHLAQLHFVIGDLLMLCAILAWSFYSWLLARPPAAWRGEVWPLWDWKEFLLVQMLFGMVWAALAAGGEAILVPASIHWSAGVVAALLFVAIGPAVIAYRCWGAGVAEGGPTIAAFFFNLAPVFAALLSSLTLGEAPKAYHALAFVLIVAGIAVSSLRR
jgi:drug/metabolite transporter (DMT)-like permease